jgi:hypothetical protein
VNRTFSKLKGSSWTASLFLEDTIMSKAQTARSQQDPPVTFLAEAQETISYAIGKIQVIELSLHEFIRLHTEPEHIEMGYQLMFDHVIHDLERVVTFLRDSRPSAA